MVATNAPTVVGASAVCAGAARSGTDADMLFPVAGDAAAAPVGCCWGMLPLSARKRAMLMMLS